MKTSFALVLLFCIAEGFGQLRLGKKLPRGSKSLKGLGMLPNQILYKLYTGKTVKEYESAARQFDGPLKFKEIKPGKPILLILSGKWVNNYTEVYADAFIRAYGTEDVNLILADWPVRGVPTNGTISEAIHAGTFLAQALTDLMDQGFKLDRVVAHRMGVIAAIVAGIQMKKYKINRIVALDPIPEITVIYQEAIKNSANLVEVVHMSNDVGPIGHRDFYPNGGLSPQPRCLDKRCDSDLAFKYYVSAYSKCGKSQLYMASYCSSYEDYLQNTCASKAFISLNNHEAKRDVPEGLYYLTTIL